MVDTIKSTCKYCGEEYDMEILTYKSKKYGRFHGCVDPKKGRVTKIVTEPKNEWWRTRDS